MFTMELLRNIVNEFRTVFRYLNNTNISAAVSQLENAGAYAAQYSRQRADQIYNLIDRTSNVICHVENRVPSEYEKFRKAAGDLYISILGDYLLANDSQFKKMTLDSKSVISYAERRDRYAFTLAKQLASQIREYSYKAGADYLYYVESLSYDGTNFSRLITLTREYCGNAMKEATTNLSKRV